MPHDAGRDSSGTSYCLFSTMQQHKEPSHYRLFLFSTCLLFFFSFLFSRCLQLLSSQACSQIFFNVNCRTKKGFSEFGGSDCQKSGWKPLVGHASDCYPRIQLLIFQCALSLWSIKRDKQYTWLGFSRDVWGAENLYWLSPPRSLTSCCSCLSLKAHTISPGSLNAASHRKLSWGTSLLAYALFHQAMLDVKNVQ